MKRNPKLNGSALFDCIPQEGKCPQGCNQCFFNRCFYTETPLIPSIEEMKSLEETPIVRMNTGHDSNINRDLVIKVAERYPEVFFNTSIPKFDFPGPVVWTANPKEEQPAVLIEVPENLMFVRLRVSSTNLELIHEACKHYHDVPVVLTFMAYYDGPPEPVLTETETENYTFMIRHTNNYWCPKDTFIKRVMSQERVHLCGKWCRDCRNCETFYWKGHGRQRGL